MKKTYCVIGKMRAGKDVVADYICERTGGMKFPLAEPLKKLVCNLFGITMGELDQYKNEHWKMYAFSDNQTTNLEKRNDLEISFRSVLQKTGDSMKDFFGLDCYMKKLHENILRYNRDVSVIPDVRLLEEQRWLTVHTNPIFIKVVREIEEDKDSTHRTETETEELGHDAIIENNGTIEELYAKIDLILK